MWRERNWLAMLYAVWVFFWCDHKLFYIFIWWFNSFFYAVGSVEISACKKQNGMCCVVAKILGQISHSYSNTIGIYYTFFCYVKPLKYFMTQLNFCILFSDIHNTNTYYAIAPHYFQLPILLSAEMLCLFLTFATRNTKRNIKSNYCRYRRRRII